MSAQQWAWTPEQWGQIVDCARKASGCRRCARIDRAMFRASGARWLLDDALRTEKVARGFERRIVSLLRMWAPELTEVAP